MNRIDALLSAKHAHRVRQRVGESKQRIAHPCQWRMLPKDFPPCSAVQRYFYEWRAIRISTRINHQLVMAVRELEGKEASPSAGAIDSQSVKTTESAGIRGFDAGKKIKGRKRHIIVDTLGLMVGLMVHSADIQDRDGAPNLPAIKLT